MSSPLTARQAEIIEFITAHAERNGRPPTVREIGAHFGIGSPNGVLCHLKALERKGRIRRGSAQRKRSLEVLPDPADET